MKSSLLKPAPYFDQLHLPIFNPHITGADSVQQKGDSVYAEFLDSDISHVASCFIEGEKQCQSNIQLLFLKKCKKMFFFRIEHFERADIAVNIDTQEEAEVFFVILVKNEQNTSARIRISGNIEKKANLNIILLHINEGDFQAEISADMRGENAMCSIALAEIGHASAKSDIRGENISSVSNTSGTFKTRCMLFENAFAKIQAVPTVKKGAENCKNHLDQKTIILSPNARSESLPLLAIANNNVSASHKSSLARLSEDDLFYFESRGINKKSAEKLLLDGFLTEIFSGIPEEGVQKCMMESAQNFLEQK